MTRALFASTSLLLCIACTPATPNYPPTARLRTPALWDARLPVELDARRSTDADGGTLVAFTYTFGDGLPSVERTEPSVKHVYPGPGRFTMQLSVRDDGDLTSSVTREI